MSEIATMDSIRQLAHWESAVRRLSALDDLASPQAWAGLENYLGVALRRSLGDAVDRLKHSLARVRPMLDTNQSDAQTEIFKFRTQYTRVESVLDFFVNAMNTRSSPQMGSLLSTCDWLASESMSRTLVPLGFSRPPVLVYVEKGLGASILKAGMRLWDGATDNPAAAIKVTFHNLLRPTALIHEAGHQVAHLLGWVPELAQQLEAVAPFNHKETWAAWASEIAADAYAFVNTGYASVLALTDVIDGGAEAVYHMEEGDSHPVPWLRVLLGVAMCRVSFGPGPWDEFAIRWTKRYPIKDGLLADSIDAMDAIAKDVLQRTYKAFGGRALVRWIDPEAVSPRALWQLEREAGAALHISPYWARQGLRIVALSGYRIGVEPFRAGELLQQQQKWMTGAANALKN